VSLSLLAEWVNKAEADYQSAVALHRRRKAPLPDIVCYHCQQCVEKYLKAYLIGVRLFWNEGELTENQ
jgi:HEPN domain-containing protein